MRAQKKTVRGFLGDLQAPIIILAIVAAVLVIQGVPVDLAIMFLFGSIIGGLGLMGVGFILLIFTHPPVDKAPEFDPRAGADKTEYRAWLREEILSGRADERIREKCKGRQ